MKNRHNEIDSIISAMVKSGHSKDRIFLNIKKAGVQISAHELRHRINLVFTKIMYGGMR